MAPQSTTKYIKSTTYNYFVETQSCLRCSYGFLDWQENTTKKLKLLFCFLQEMNSNGILQNCDSRRLNNRNNTYNYGNK